MKAMIPVSIFCQLVILFSACDKHEPGIESQIGHFELNITYITNGIDGQIPDEGSRLYIFGEQAKCIDYWDAIQGFATLDGKTTTYRYSGRANENGDIFMYNLRAGSYYIVVISTGMTRYTERIIEVPLGDTLKLAKNFSNAAHFDRKLEPWDYVINSE
jgi:hypothetical protein